MKKFLKRLSIVACLPLVIPYLFIIAGIIFPLIWLFTGRNMYCEVDPEETVIIPLKYISNSIKQQLRKIGN